MKQYLTPHHIANTVRLTRSLHKGSFLILEGDTDVRVFKRFVDETNCKVIPAHGKDHAIDVLDILEKENFKGLLVIVDADFWHLDGFKPDNVNLLLTDTHDLETMILSASEVLDKILSEFGSDKKMKLIAKPVINLVLECASPIGFLRWISSPSKDNLNLKFRGLAFESFVDKAKLHININKFIEDVRNHSGDVDINEKAIKNKIKSLKKENLDPWQVCSGHDMVQILAIGLRFVFGNRKSKTLTAEILEGMLRVAYEYSHFRLSRLHQSIKKWEKVNLSFKVLRQ